MKFYNLAGIYAIDLEEIQAVEFCEQPRDDGKYRIKILFKGNGMHWYDVSKREFDKFAITLLRENRIC